MTPRTMFDKVWDAHVVHERPDGWVLLYIDRIFLHEGSFPSFKMLAEGKRTVRRPAQNFGIADHLVPTIGQARGTAGIAVPELRKLAEAQIEDTRRAKIRLYGLGDPDQGIVHVVGPEQGITQPAMTIICGDSHTSTHGAFGSFAFGVGNSELAHAMATQTLWLRKPKRMRAHVSGALGPNVGAKDIALALIGNIGTAGATGHVIEFDGPVMAELSMAGRMTICNMSIEAGSRAGMVTPDATTIDYVRGRPHAPKGELFDRAVAAWRALATDPGATFDTEVTVDASALSPMVTWGTSPEDVVPVSGHAPDPSGERDDQRKAHIARALDYMGLQAGQRMTDVAIDRVFIGSCTNSRIEDLRDAARVVAGKQIKVPGWVVPGSGPVMRQAEAEGLAKIFVDAGFEWREPGCSMCLGVNGEILKPKERCASTSNRNFEGRQGPGGRTHLMSPAMAAAAALHGHIVDVRSEGGR